jgi:TatD DNase family protein
MLIDTHCHLDPGYFAEGAEAVMTRARAAGVTGFVTIGVGADLEPARRAVALAAACPDVWATVCVHPHDAGGLDEAAFAELLALAARDRVVAVGEIGLDYHYMRSPREQQQAVFRRFVALARAVHKPIVVHTREAAADTLSILEEEGAREVGGIIHCFSEDRPFAERALALGFDLSFSGIVTFKTATAIQ